jgi:hypothetical protein
MAYPALCGGSEWLKIRIVIITASVVVKRTFQLDDVGMASGMNEVGMIVTYLYLEIVLSVFEPFKDVAQTALFKATVRTAQ